MLASFQKAIMKHLLHNFEKVIWHEH